MLQNQPLTLKEFVKRDPTPRWDNFDLYFDLNGMAPHLRQTPQFLYFRAKELDLEARLTHGVTNRDRSVDKAESLKPLETDMYTAYSIIFNYLVEHNSVNPNEDLLIAPE